MLIPRNLRYLPRKAVGILEVMLPSRGARFENACAKCKPIWVSNSRHSDRQYL